jgi:hypothetical protein
MQDAPAAEELPSEATIVPISGDARSLALFEATRSDLGGDGGRLVGVVEGGNDGPRPGDWLKLNVGDRQLPTIAIPQRRLADRSRQLYERLSRESRDDQSVLGELRAELTGDVPAIQISRFATMSSKNAFLLDARAQPLMVNESMGAMLERARAVGVRVSEEQLQLLPASQRINALAGRMPAMRSFAARYRATISGIAGVLRDPTAPEPRQLLTAAAMSTFDAVVEQWPLLRNDPEARSLAARALNALTRQSELKTIYGIRSRFPTSSYQTIFLQSNSVVALLDGQNTICGGYAITLDWVLTAGHCFKGRAWQRIAVQFSGASGPIAPARAVDDVWPDPPYGSQTRDAIDFAFVHLAETPAAAADQAGPAFPPFSSPCLRTGTPRFEEPVIVIGRLQSDMLVFDHAYVWYPFQVYDSELRVMEARTGLRLQQLAESLYPESPTNQENFFQAQMRGFEEAYSVKVGEGSGRVSEYWSMLAETRTKRPLFGFDTDTQHGNSGAPVFSREDNCLIGVFVGGQPDRVLISDANWKEHEFATPIDKVLTQIRVLRDQLPAPGQGSATDEARRALAARLEQLRR